MIEIINTIIELDREATKRLEDANQQCENIRGMAKAEGERIREEMMHRMERRIGIVTDTEQEHLEKLNAAVDARKSEQIKALDSLFSTKREQWEQDILARIIEV